MNDDAQDPAPAPFIGLRPFGYDDRADFFGRREQAYALYRLTAFGFIAVIGSSGSGKSSLVRAGLFPLLLDDHEATRWTIVATTPAGRPIARLADALGTLQPQSDPADRAVQRDRIDYLLRRSSAGLAEAIGELRAVADGPVLVVIDQFEEIFRYASTGTPGEDRLASARWRDEATSFVALLLTAFRRRSNVHVLVTMRSDFIGDCAQFAGLAEAVSDTQFLVPSLSRAQRADAIRAPLDGAGASIEPTLVERLLNDVGHELDQLPVLQHCLLRMWQRAATRSDPPALTAADYDAVGTMDGALSQHADEVMRDLPGLEPVVEQVFRALSERDREGRATRRPLPFRRLVEETGALERDVRRVVDRFRATDCSFLLPSPTAVTPLQDDTRIDVVHEALLRRWERMNPIGAATHGWLDAEDDDGCYYRSILARIDLGERTLPIDRVTERYAWWTSRPRTTAWTQRYGGRAGDVERFFRDSLAARDADVRARRANRARGIAGVAVLLLAIITGIVYADVTSERARGTALVAQSKIVARDATRATESGDAVTGMLLALEALPLRIDRADRPFVADAALALQQAVQRRTEIRDFLPTTPWFSATTFSPDGRRVAGLDLFGHVFLWRATDGALLRTFGSCTQFASRLAFSPDGKRIATACWDGVAHVYEARSGTTLLTVRAHRKRIVDIAYSNSGARIATASRDHTVRVWDARTGRPIRTFASHATIRTTRFWPDDDHLAAVGRDDVVTVWDLRSGRLERTLRGPGDRIEAAALSHDGRRVATASLDRSGRVWDALTGRTIATLRGHDDALNHIAFSDDDAKIVTASNDQTARVWDPRTGAQLTVLRGHDANVLDARYSPDGRYIASASDDGTVRMWDPDRVERPLALDHGGAYVPFDVYSRSGRELYTGAEDDVVREWDARRGRVLRTFVGHTGVVQGLCLSPDGTLLASASVDGTVRVWDVRRGRAIRVLRVGGAVYGVAFLDHGRQLIVSGNRITLWSLARGALLRTLPLANTGTVYAFSLAPDESRIALVSANDGTAVADLRSGQLLMRLSADGAGVEYSPDGTKIVGASGTSDHMARIWDARSGAVILTLNGHHGEVMSATFSSDGTRVATTSGDKTVRLWNASSGRTLDVLRGMTGMGTHVAFSPDGRALASAAGDGAVRVWQLHDFTYHCQALIDDARAHLPRMLSAAQREDEAISPRAPAPLVDLFGTGDTCR